EFLRRQLAQLLVDQGQELLRGVGIAPLDGGQDAGYLVHGRLLPQVREHSAGSLTSRRTLTSCNARSSLAGGHRVYRGPGDNASAGRDGPEFFGVDAPVQLGVLGGLPGTLLGCCVGVNLSSRSVHKTPTPWAGRLRLSETQLGPVGRRSPRPKEHNLPRASK